MPADAFTFAALASVAPCRAHTPRQSCHCAENWSQARLAPPSPQSAGLLTLPPLTAHTHTHTQAFPSLATSLSVELSLTCCRGTWGAAYKCECALTHLDCRTCRDDTTATVAGKGEPVCEGEELQDLGLNSQTTVSCSLLISLGRGAKGTSVSLNKASQMENNNDGPAGVRDYPPGCIPAPRSSQKSRMGATLGGTTRVDADDEELSDCPLVSLPADFDTFDARDQFLERRRVYERLRQQYERKKERGESIPRPDLTAMKQMNHEGLSCKYRDVGDVPGLIVGDTFEYRSEMFVVALHCRVQAGISYTEKGRELVATSIVVSGGYEDDADYGEVLHYSGEGGNDYKGGRRQVGDQEQRGGNEAMMNSCSAKKPVRVIRGHDVQTTKGWNKIYSYDGLYTVFYAKPEVGASGHKVYKFKLRRLPNQPDLKIKTVQFNGAQLS